MQNDFMKRIVLPEGESVNTDLVSFMDGKRYTASNGVVQSGFSLKEFVPGRIFFFLIVPKDAKMGYIRGCEFVEFSITQRIIGDQKCIVSFITNYKELVVRGVVDIYGRTEEDFLITCSHGQITYLKKSTFDQFDKSFYHNDVSKRGIVNSDFSRLESIAMLDSYVRKELGFGKAMTTRIHGSQHRPISNREFI